MEKKQLIISVGREFGSGGHVIAEKLSKKFGLPLYDYNLLHAIADEKELDSAVLEKYDEIPKNRLISRRVKGYSNSPQENIAKMQFNYLREKAANGESFIIVGRCAEEILKGHEGLVTVFILGDMEQKIERIAKIHNLTPKKAKKLIVSTNRKRKMYHNYYCKTKWGDSRNYELSINSSKLGIEGTTEFVAEYINRRHGEVVPK